MCAGARTPPRQPATRRQYRLSCWTNSVAGAAEQGDDLAIESRNVVGLAAADKIAVNYHLLVFPLATRISDIGFQ
jgi:hypothetical protein